MKHTNRPKFYIGLILAALFILPFAYSLPAGPIVTYVSNTTATAVIPSRSTDAKGTITTVTMDVSQQDYKWKAYVGNVTGKLALDDAAAKTIYDWNLGTVTGEIYATRASGTVNWLNVSCVTQTVVGTEQSALGMSSSVPDNINNTFNHTTHRSFAVGTVSIANSTCKSTATYINDSAQTITEAAYFQEILLEDSVASTLIYSTLIETDHLAFNLQTYDFQMLVAENESSGTPLTYYFYVELG